MRGWQGRTIAALVLAMTMTTAMAVTVPATAGATHSWNGYHWARTANPFTLKLGDNVSSAWDASLSRAASDWSASSKLDATVVAGTVSPKTCKATSGQVQVCSAAYGRTGWLGLAQIWISGSHIVQGVVKANDTYFTSSTYDKPEWRNLVVCQEIGHTLGLDHQDENFNNPNLGTCMDYTSSPLGPPDNQDLNQHDYDQLVTIYTHLDATTTVSASASAGARSQTGDPGDWGRLVAGSEDPHSTAVYERDLGNGQRIVTFVIWATG